MEIYRVLKSFTFLGDSDAFAVNDVVALPQESCVHLVEKGYLELLNE